ncbi:MAG: DNA replication/repair protein RecF [bacterium]|nr:DNA replication/repair protein RecF [bacterium]
MHINSLKLQNFRNYTEAVLEFSPLTNMIYGDNAQGKTNILEAVYMFAQGRSHRAKSDKELIRFGADMAQLEITFEDADRSYTAKMRLCRRNSGKKSVWINSVPINKLSKLMSYLNVVMFSPEDLDLVKGSPAFRRRFIDSALSQLYPKYLISLSEYSKALAQKNSLLKQLKANGKSSDSLLTVWNMTLAEKGALIMKYRSEFLERLNEFASSIQKEICGEELRLEYSPSIKTENELDENEFLSRLEAAQEREILFASALLGIQRDNLSITINGKEARLYGSQGQQRTAALSIKIAQADCIQHIRDEYPVLLLDDIMSELDINRRMYLAQRIKNKQVLITSTDTDLTKSTAETHLFRIQSGSVIM